MNRWPLSDLLAAAALLPLLVAGLPAAARSDGSEAGQEWAVEDVSGLHAADVTFPHAGGWGTRFEAAQRARACHVRESAITPEGLEEAIVAL